MKLYFKPGSLSHRRRVEHPNCGFIVLFLSYMDSVKQRWKTGDAHGVASPLRKFGGAMRVRLLVSSRVAPTLLLTVLTVK
jgi:hypothetical protein